MPIASMNSAKRLPLALGLLLAAAVTLSGCGRKGALEPPPGAAVKSAPVSADPATGGKTQVEDRPFVLDPLI